MRSVVWQRNGGGYGATDSIYLVFGTGVLIGIRSKIDSEPHPQAPLMFQYVTFLKLGGAWEQ